MIDLHTHTNCSDGVLSPVEVLMRAELRQLTHFSITDHNSVEAYFQVDEPGKYFSGKLITGVEAECFYMGREVELLGYNFDAVKMRELLKGIYKTSAEVEVMKFGLVYDAFFRAGVKFSPNVLQTWDRKRHYYSGAHLWEDMKKYPENYRFIPDEESRINNITFYRRHICNRNDALYVDISPCFPSIGQVVEILKAAGAQIFVPHVFLYGEDSEEILRTLVRDFPIDGVECFYPKFTQKQTKFLLQFCKRNGLLVSAGSDFHGKTGYPDDVGTPIEARELGWL